MEWVENLGDQVLGIKKNKKEIPAKNAVKLAHPQHTYIQKLFGTQPVTVPSGLMPLGHVTLAPHASSVTAAGSLCHSFKNPHPSKSLAELGALWAPTSRSS